MPPIKKKTILAIILHSLSWIFFFLAPFVNFPNGFDFDIQRLQTHIVFTSGMMLLFYLNYFVFIPKLLEKRKIWVYLLIVIISVTVFSIGVDLVFHSRFAKPPHLMVQEDSHRPAHMESDGFKGDRPPETGSPFRAMSLFLTITMVSIGIRMTSVWFRTEQNKRDLENDKLKAELAALKAQVNPHFFFNVMNSLCSLARKKSDETENYIIKLSEVLRYNLNDLTEDKVPLDKEIQFIQNYIDIQHLRLPLLHPVSIRIKGSPDNYLIEPMLLFPFVENAFKHGSGYSSYLFINIQLTIEDCKLEFVIENSCAGSDTDVETPISAGIGIQNARRRLNLLYPEKHALIITKESGIFKVKVNLDLSC